MKKKKEKKQQTCEERKRKATEEDCKLCVNYLANLRNMGLSELRGCWS